MSDGLGKVFFGDFLEIVLKPFSGLKDSGEGIPKYNLLSFCTRFLDPFGLHVGVHFA